MQQFLVKTPREINFFMADAFENNCFLFLWHVWAKLVTGVAAIAGMLASFCAVNDHLVWLL